MSEETGNDSPPTSGRPIAPKGEEWAIQHAIVHAFEAGYMDGHNDTVESRWRTDTYFVAQDRTTKVVKETLATLAASVSRERLEEIRKIVEKVVLRTASANCPVELNFRTAMLEFDAALSTVLKEGKGEDVQ